VYPSPKQIGRIVGEASPDSFIFVSKKDDHPPKFEYVTIRSTELVDGEKKEVNVLAQVVGVLSRSTTYTENLDYDALERIHRAGLEDVNILCLARTLGYLHKSNGRTEILMPRRAIYPGNEVYLAPDELVKEFFSYPEEEGLHIGYLISRPSIPVHISVNGFRRHVAIIAQTGAGKSYTTGVLIEELLKKGATIIVIDPHADYVFLSRTREGRRYQLANNIQVFRNPNSTGRYSEKDIENLKPLTYNFAELEPEDLSLIAGIPETYTKINTAIEKAVKRLRKNPLKKDSYTADDLIDELENEDEKDLKDAAQRAKRYVKRIKRFKVFSDRTTSIKDVVKPSTASIIDLSGLNYPSMDYIAYRILEGALTLKTTGEFEWPIFIFIEEAHKFVPNKKRSITKPIVNTIAAEGRKFGVFLTLITQRPSKIDPDSLSQCNSQIILRITNPHDQAAVQAASERLSENLMRDLPGLNVGEAIITGNIVRAPVLVKIRQRETMEGGADINVAEELRKTRQHIHNTAHVEEEPQLATTTFSEV